MSSPTVTQNKPSRSYSYVDVLYLCLSFILIFYFICESNIFTAFIGRTSAVFLLLHALIALSYALGKQKLKTKKEIGNALFILLCILPNLIYPKQSILNFFNFFFVNALLAYYFMSISHHQLLQKESNWILLDFLISIFKLPFHFMSATLSFIKELIPCRNNKNLIKILLGIFISIPILLIILPLLAQADETFQYYLSQIHIDIDFIKTFALDLVLTLPIFFYLFSLSYGNLNHETGISFQEAKTKEKLNKLSFFPSMIYLTTECILALTYFLFLLSSFTSILHVFGASRDQFSYAAFAREGFFQLLMIACINLVMLTFFHITGKNETAGTIHMERVLCLETILFILSALFKMGLYVTAYHAFTYLRIYATWLMLVLLGIFIFMMLGSIKKQNPIQWIVKYCILCFFFLNIIGIDHIATDHIEPFAQENLLDS